MCTDCGCSRANSLANLNSHDSKKKISNVKSLNFTRVQHNGPQQGEVLAKAEEIAIGPTTATAKKMNLEIKVLADNDFHAAENRRWLKEKNVCAINIMSSPGSGKTSLVEKTAGLLAEKRYQVAVLVGDQQTDRDAQRIARTHAVVKQINTISSCHLDAKMIHKELIGFVPTNTQFLIIENVGNLVCPAAFDLGQKLNIAVLSVTEGEDKPIKYPVLFHNADCIIISKCDLLPHLEWDKNSCEKFIRQINPKSPIFFLSSKTSEGMTDWIDWLVSNIP